ncbi:cytochrome P450 [Halteromyces radiatus]|uniref:cytochrome P450 n=1 Tax=Halteromyces radiatus TaxID=101107 RepID=UPI0022201E9F|nr:cytochrome P450 [Halteromyces radiatus]KAI8077707.1 cytochrome P450 [Halteromyces radiatus]
MLSGDAWRRHRKIVNPAFNLSMPIGLFGEFTQVMFNTIDKLGSKVDVLTLFERLTLDVMGRYLLSFDFKALEDQENEWVSVYNSVKDGIMSPFFLVFSIFDTDWVHLFPKRAKAHDNMTRFLNMLDSIIEKKRLALKENKNRNQSLDAQDRDLLTMMIESEDGNGGAALSNEELRKNLCMFFLAGHDTTAFTLSFMVYELAKHPDVQEKARQEAIRILGDKPMDVLPTIEDIRKMTYINAVMKETMRLHNPLLATTTRQATEDCQLGSVYVPRGAFVCADMTNLHRNPKVWSSPYTFNPDRFLPGGEAERHPGSGLAWIPFSNGSRMCVGANFSMNEQRVVMSMLLRKFTWKLPSDSIHANGLITRGLAFSIISTTSLDINFEKRY